MTLVGVTGPADLVATIDLGPLEGLVGYHLRRASAKLRSDYARALGETGVRQVLFGILSVISVNPGVNQGTVARALGIQRPNMVGLVNELIARGLVARHSDANDRRAFTLSLTKSGSTVVVEALVRIRAHEERILSDLTAEERRLLVRLLDRVGTTVTDLTGAEAA